MRECECEPTNPATPSTRSKPTPPTLLPYSALVTRIPNYGDSPLCGSSGPGAQLPAHSLGISGTVIDIACELCVFRLPSTAPRGAGVFLPGRRKFCTRYAFPLPVLTCGVCVVGAGFGTLDGCEVRLCGPRAFVRPRVPCVPCVSRLPPVSFYRYPSVPAPPGVFLPVLGCRRKMKPPIL